jgi:hypothetical protein
MGPLPLQTSPLCPLKLTTLCPPLSGPHTMPPKTSRIAKCAQRKNASLVKDIMASASGTVFARIEANIGPQFRVAIFNTGSKKTYSAFGSPRGLFRQKNGVRFRVNDIVVLSSLPLENQLCEIIGLIERKEASELYKNGHIDTVIFTPVEAEGTKEKLTEDVFDYTDEVDVETL